MSSYIFYFIIACFLRALVFLHCIIDSMFFSALNVLSCKNCLNIGLILRSTKLKTVCQYLLNPEMEIPTTQEILLFRLVVCAVFLFFGAKYCDCIVCWFILLCVKHMQWLSQNFVCLKQKILFFRRLYNRFYFFLQQDVSSLLLYSFPSSDALVLENHFALQLSWLLNMCSRRTLLICHNSSKKTYIILHHIPPILIDYYSIWCGASTSMSLTIVKNRKDVLTNNLNKMGGGWK